MEMEPTVSSETSAIRTQTPGNYPKRNKLHLEHGESSKTRKIHIRLSSRGQLKCDGTRAANRFRLSAKRTSPFKSTGASVQSTAGSRGVRISGSNAGYTMFRSKVKSTGYPLHSPVSPSLPPLRHRLPSQLNWSLTAPTRPRDDYEWNLKLC